MSKNRRAPREGKNGIDRVSTAAPKVSVLTPVYNVAEYLPLCLDSLKAQTLDSIEFICIDDGSTDASLEILKRYAADDDRFVIVQNGKNRGYGATMNHGLSIARGEYIGIVESDDYASDTMFENLYERAKEHDADLCKANGHFKFDSSGKHSFVKDIPSIMCNELFDTMDEGKRGIVLSRPCIWSAIYKRNFLEQNDIRFTETPGASFQDTAFVLKAWIAARRVFVTRSRGINYRVDRGDSSVLSKGKIFCVRDEYASVEEWLKARPELGQAFTGVLNATKVGTYIWNMQRLSKPDRKEFLDAIVPEFKAIVEEGKISRENLNDKRQAFLDALVSNPASISKNNWALLDYASSGSVKLAAPAGQQEDVLVSVIVPIYNVADYLAQCLDSILGQTHVNLEVICVNDGSTDDSLAIMREYEQRDSRVRVIDKPNGGYGHSVNRGLDEAKGDWISIVEPDDFIGKHMYADLLSYAVLGNGDMADVVKSSYWLYFDLPDGSEPYVEPPNLMSCMPRSRKAFNVSRSWEVLRHHPSIWSAIYRRSFIEDFGIRMIEPRGAGWADNPWFFETLLQAQTMVWVPSAYYYYRQTNPNASSNLRDFHLPFDRLRDIRAVYDRLGVVDPDLLTVLYQRSFNYIINSILEEYDFDESDPELESLISEVLDTMDPSLVMADGNGISRTAKKYYRDFQGIRLREIQEQERFLAKRAATDAAAASSPAPAVDDTWNLPVCIPDPGKEYQPTISVILAMKDDRAGLWSTLDSLLSQDYPYYEVLCYDCGSKDRSAEIVQGLAKIDARFKLVAGWADTAADAFNGGITRARGKYLYFLRPGVTLGGPEVFGALVDAASTAETPKSGVYLFGSKFGGGLLSSKRPGSDVNFSVVTVEGNEAELLCAESSAIYSRFFVRDALLRSSLRFKGSADDDGYIVGISAVVGSDDVGVVEGVFHQGGPRSALIRNRMQDEQSMIDFELDRLEAVDALASSIEDERKAFAIRATMIKFLARALNFAGRYKAREAYFNTFKNVFWNRFGLQDVPNACAGLFSERLNLERAFGMSYDEHLRRELQIARAGRGAARSELSSLAGDFEVLEGEHKKVQKRLTRVQASKSYKLSRGISKTAKAVVPKGVLRKLQG